MINARKEPKFEKAKPDFDPVLSPLSGHPEYPRLSTPEKLKIGAWLAQSWTYDTLWLESFVLPCATRAVLGTTALSAEVKKLVAHVASEEEGRHVSDAVRQGMVTARERGLDQTPPCGLLIRNFEREMSRRAGRDRDLFGLGVSTVVETSQGALQHLSKSETINPFQRYYHLRHWRDEEGHQQVFADLAPVFHRALDPSERASFLEGIAAAAWWIGTIDEELNRSVLVGAGLSPSRAVRIVSELSRANPPVPDTSGERLFRAMGEPYTTLIVPPRDVNLHDSGAVRGR